MGANPHPKPVDLGCESAENWLLPSTSTSAMCIEWRALYHLCCVAMVQYVAQQVSDCPLLHQLWWEVRGMHLVLLYVSAYIARFYLLFIVLISTRLLHPPCPFRHPHALVCKIQASRVWRVVGQLWWSWESLTSTYDFLWFNMLSSPFLLCFSHVSTNHCTMHL